MIDWEAFYSSFRQPDFVPGYEIQHRLGGGAFGEVYLARKRSIGKAYAIKFLKLAGGEGDSAARELEHVRLFAAIDHPNLVTIEDMGMALGVPYLILGYAGEDTLARRLRRGELALDQSLSFFVQACRGVLALHDRRLAHFDLKPANIFLRGEVARVGDYGLARLLADGRSTLSFGRGTPHYMAPEMLVGRADQRADVYSLGVILYESLTGRLPYPADPEVGLPLREHDEAPEFPPEYPAALQALTARALRIEPRDRLSSVRALLEELGESPAGGDPVLLAQLGPDHAPAASASGAGMRAPNEAAASTAAASASAAPAANARGGNPELREAAAELVRGAVLVARGVWDGARRGASATPAAGTQSSAPPSSGAAAGPAPATDTSLPPPVPSEVGHRLPPPLPTSASATLAGTTPARRETVDVPPAKAASAALQTGALHNDVIALRTLEEPDELVPSTPALGRGADEQLSRPGSASVDSAAQGAAHIRSGPASAQRPRSAAQSDLLELLARERGRLAASEVPGLPALAGPALAPTVPVPPRVGGLAGSAAAIAQLGVEVMLAVLRGPVAWCVRGAQAGAARVMRGAASVLRGARSSFGYALRLALLLIACGLIGALAVALLYVAF
jgi:hypothetical protein